MKKLFFLMLGLALILDTGYSQAPQSFKYQTVVRNSTGDPIPDQVVKFRISILKGSESGMAIYSEIHSITTNDFGLATLNIGNGSAPSSNFSEIAWADDLWFLRTELDPAGGTAYQLMGTTQLLSVPFALYSNKTNTNAKFVVKGTEELGPDSALFEVKDRNGLTVFAVYEDGAVLYVKDGAKGGRGGFSVGGRQPGKAYVIEDILQVTPDSVRIYINDNTLGKGGRGGFTVGGRTPSKAPGHEFLRVTPDSVRINLNPSSGKGASNGFIVTQNNAGVSKDIMRMSYLNTQINTTDTVNYFMVGNTKNGVQANLIDLNTNNYFIGHESGKNIVKVKAGLNFPDPAQYNLFIGYQAGKSATSAQNNLLFGYQSGMNLTSGVNNIFQGYQAGYHTTGGAWNMLFGYQAGYSNVNGLSNIFIGDMSGYNHVNGHNNLFLGKETGYYDTLSYNCVYLGSYAGNKTVNGNGNTYVGVSAGAGISHIASEGNTYLGATAGFANSDSYNTFIGNEAGIYNQVGSRNVYIGYAAGRRTNGSKNIIIGNKANYKNGATADNFTNVVAIGDSLTITSSNEVRLGNASSNALYSQGAYASTTTLAPNLYVNPSGRIMRSTTTIPTGTGNMIQATVTLNLPSIGAYSSYTATFAVTGATTTSSVMISPQSGLTDGLIIAYARVWSAGSVEVKFYNATGTAIDVGSMAYYITVVD
jgi:hypothetical protein